MTETFGKGPKIACFHLNNCYKAVSEALNQMKTRQKNMKKTRRSSPLRRVVRVARPVKEPTLLEKIAQVTDELQILRSRLANAGDDFPTVGTHRISALEADLERLWDRSEEHTSE